MKKILVVDDNKNITSLVGTILDMAGYSYMTSNSGKECLDLIHDNKFDMILMDIAMPEITGLDVLNKMKENGLLSSNRVVLFTASSKGPIEVEEFKKMGALDCMRKPFTKAELLSTIEKYAA